MKSRSTLTDIAEAMGISVATVHRALTGKGRISPETKARILKTAQEMRYSPNLIASTLSSKRQLRFSFICPDNFFYQEIIEGARRATQELAAFGVETDYMLSGGYNPVDQIAALKSVLASGKYTGVALSTTHNLLLNPAVDALSEAGIPTIAFNNDLSSSRRLCFIGEDPLVSGRFSAEIYASTLPEGSEIAVMRSLVPAEGLTLRVDGFVDGIQEFAKHRLLGVYDYYDDLKSAEQTAEQILTGTNAHAIFANSMIGSLGIGRAIRKVNRDAFVIGYDLNDEMQKNIHDGKLFGTLFQSPYKQGYYAIRLLYKALTGSMQAIRGKKFHIPTQLLLKSNLEQASRNYGTMFSELD